MGVRGTTDDAGTFSAGSGSGTPPIPLGAPMTNRLTRYVGRACPGDPAPPAPAGATVAVVSRGLCTFTEKIAAVEAAGYEAAIVVNREGSDGCGVFGMTVEGGIPALSIPRSDGFALFDKGGFNLAACLAGTAELIPGVALGETGDRVNLSSFFDGWGYVHLYRNGPGKLVELDRFAIPEAMNPAYRIGLRRPVRARGCGLADAERPGVLLVLLRRLPRPQDRQRQARRGRALHRRAWKRLLGRAGLPPRGPGVRRRERHGPRAVHLQVHRQRLSAAGSAVGPRRKPRPLHLDPHPAVLDSDRESVDRLVGRERQRTAGRDVEARAVAGADRDARRPAPTRPRRAARRRASSDPRSRSSCRRSCRRRSRAAPTR